MFSLRNCRSLKFSFISINRISRLQFFVFFRRWHINTVNVDFKSQSRDVYEMQRFFLYIFTSLTYVAVLNVLFYSFLLIRSLISVCDFSINFFFTFMLALIMQKNYNFVLIYVLIHDLSQWYIFVNLFKEIFFAYQKFQRFEFKFAKFFLFIARETLKIVKYLTIF